MQQPEIFLAATAWTEVILGADNTTDPSLTFEC